MSELTLVTYAEYLELPPLEQGYVAYTQADIPGSELRDHNMNPYSDGSPEFIEWNAGQIGGMIGAQDSEE